MSQVVTAWAKLRRPPPQPLTAVLVVRYLQFRSHFRWAVSNLVALVRWSLFTYRNLWEWLDRPFDTPPLAPDQLELKLDSIRTAG